MTPKDGGPAFPREDYQADDAPDQRGMSLRDYFAGRALAVLVHDLITGSHIKDGIGISLADDTRAVAGEAYCYADAMLAEREKEPKS